MGTSLDCVEWRLLTDMSSGDFRGRDGPEKSLRESRIKGSKGDRGKGFDTRQKVYRVRMTVTIFGVFVLEYNGIPDAIFSFHFPGKQAKSSSRVGRLTLTLHLIIQHSFIRGAQPLLLLKACIC